MSWPARASSGYAGGALLQPNQVLISHEDAVLHSIKQLGRVRVRFAATHAVLVLESVIDRHQSTALGRGRIQLHPWVLDVSGQLENTLATLEPVNSIETPPCQLLLSLQTKFPLVALFGSYSEELGDLRIELLPDSVRHRQIHLNNALQRQLQAAGVLNAPQAGQLVPVKLLGDIYIFRIEAVVKLRDLTMKSHIVVKEWSLTEARDDEKTVSELTDKIAVLNMQEEDKTTVAGPSYEMALNTRLWQTGFVGYTGFMQDLLLNVALVLKCRQKKRDNEMEVEQIGSHGLLISGVHGVGKSLALVALQRELAREKINTWRIDGMSLLIREENAAFRTAYEYLTHELEQRFPCLRLLADDRTSSLCVGVVLIDDLDVLFKPANDISTGAEAQFSQLGSALLRFMDDVSLRNVRLVVVGTTGSADANIPYPMKRTGRFDKVLDLVVPTEQARRDIFRRYLTELPLRKQSEGSGRDVATNLASRLAIITGGYVAKDLLSICRSAAAQAQSVCIGEKTRAFVGLTELLRAQQQTKPSQLRELNVASPGSSQDEALAFAGYAAVQKQLFDFVLGKFHPTRAMNRLGVCSASGVLVSGPPGCGKTLLVKILAARAQVNIVTVKSSDLLSKYFGDSEKAVRQLFARARAASPCLLFFDEFDSIAHKRSFDEGDGGSSGGGVYARILSTFLNEMDGVGSQRISATSFKRSDTAKSGEIFVVAATNRKEALDAALIRPGRIDKIVELGFPTEEDIQEILSLHTSKMPLAADVNIQELASRSRNSRMFTGADLAAICKEAAFRALREDMEANVVCLRHFEAAWDQRAQATPTSATPATVNPVIPIC